MRSSRWINVALAVAIIAIIGFALVLDARRSGDHERFVGSDSAATSLVEEENPDYRPWFSSVFAPTSGEIESGLFALQAGLGGIALGYCIGALRRRRDDEPFAAVDSESARG